MSRPASIARGGHPEYFDFVECYLRNRISLLQFFVTPEFEAKYRKVNAEAGERENHDKPEIAMKIACPSP